MPPLSSQEAILISLDVLVDRLDRAALETDLDRLQFLFFANLLLPEAFHHVLPDHPTSCPPASREKKEIMRLRVQRGQSPFHPDDCDEPSRVAVVGRKGGALPCCEKRHKKNSYRAVVNRMKAGYFRTKKAASDAAQAARSAARQAIQDAQSAEGL